MKLTMKCPVCGAEFDKGLVREIADTDSVDLLEFMDGKYKCLSCGHEQKIGSVITHSPQAKSIY